MSRNRTRLRISSNASHCGAFNSWPEKLQKKEEENKIEKNGFQIKTIQLIIKKMETREKDPNPFFEADTPFPPQPTIILLFQKNF